MHSRIPPCILSSHLQISSFTNRTNIVDNSLWNSSHIAKVGLALVSTEDKVRELFFGTEIYTRGLTLEAAIGFPRLLG
jgi:hypothetical protein